MARRSAPAKWGRQSPPAGVRCQPGTSGMAISGTASVPAAETALDQSSGKAASASAAPVIRASGASLPLLSVSGSNQGSSGLRSKKRQPMPRIRAMTIAKKMPP